MAKRKMGVFRKAANLLAVALIVAGSWTQLAWAAEPAEPSVKMDLPSGTYNVGQDVNFTGALYMPTMDTTDTKCTVSAMEGRSTYDSVEASMGTPTRLENETNGNLYVSVLNATMKVNENTNAVYGIGCNKGEGANAVYLWSGDFYVNSVGNFVDTASIAAPTNLNGEYKAPVTVNLSWDASPNADSYSIYGSNYIYDADTGSITNTSNCSTMTNNTTTQTSMSVGLTPEDGTNSCTGSVRFTITSYKDGHAGKRATIDIQLSEPLAKGTLIKKANFPTGEVAANLYAPFTADLTSAATKCWINSSMGYNTDLTISNAKITDGRFVVYENYRYTLICENAAGETEKSAEWTPTIDKGPAAPTNVKAVEQKDGSVKVTWTASADSAKVKNYVVYSYADETISNGTGGGTATATNYTFSAAAMERDGSKFVAVFAENENGAKNSSARVAITPYVETETPAADENDETNPPATTNAKPTTPAINKYNGKQNPQTGDITITWTASTDADGIDHYKIEYGNEKKNSAEVAGDQTEFTIKNDGSFDFLMNCKNEKGEDSICLPVSLTAYDASAQKLASETATYIFADVKIVAPIPQAPDTDNAQNTENAPQNTLEVASVGAPADGFGLKLNSAAMIMIFGGISALILANLTKMRKFANRK